MKVLLDTHVLLWWLSDSSRLSERARRFFSDAGTSLLWSAASTWELSIQYALGRLDLPAPPRAYFPDLLRDQRIESISIVHAHAWAVADLPPHHGDPFDRLLIAQAVTERVPILTSDPAFTAYDVETLW